MRRVADELLEFGSRTGSARSKAMAGWLLTILAYLTEDERMAAKTIELAMESGGDPIYEHSPSMWRLPTLIVSGKIEEARRYHDDHYQRFVIERDIRGMADGLQIANGVLLVHEGQPEKGFDQVEQLRDEAVAAGEISKARMCEAVLAMMYAGVAMADLGIGEILSNLGFALRRGFRARREARRRLDYLLSHLDEWDLGGYRFLLELTFSRFLIDRDETGAAEEHLRRAVDAAEPAGDTAGLREAHRLLEQVVAHH